jgi:hypothetical protein
MAALNIDALNIDALNLRAGGRKRPASALGGFLLARPRLHSAPLSPAVRAVRSASSASR